MELVNQSGIKVIREGRSATVLLHVSLKDGSGERLGSVIKVYHGENDEDAAKRKAKEAFFIRRVSEYVHPNIIDEILWPEGDSRYTPPLNSLRLRYAPIALVDVLESPPILEHWPHIARSFAFQLCIGLDFLHGNGIADRDINPYNLMIDEFGELKIIDFDSACLVHTTDLDDQIYVLETPDKGNMDHQVGTGPYRAPELLFGSTTYDAFALDTWAMGAVIAELLAPAVIARCGDPSSTLQDTVDGLELSALSLQSDNAPSDLRRQTLFDASFGDLGLAASIFRLRGEPTAETWPSFQKLPDAGKFHFDITPEPWDARIPSLQHVDPGYRALLLDFLDGILCLDPSRRTSPSAALEYPWWRCSGGVLVPEWYIGAIKEQLHTAAPPTMTTTINNSGLCEMLHEHLDRVDEELDAQFDALDARNDHENASTTTA